MNKKLEDLDDASVLRELQQLSNQRRCNLEGARLARDQAERDKHQLADPEVAWLMARAQSGEQEASRMERRIAHLAEIAASRELVCSQEPYCDCPRCAQDGPIMVILGNFQTHLILLRRSGAELYMAFTGRPRRRPILLEYRGDELVPVDRGNRRREVLELIQPILAGVANQGRNGRPTGTGLTAEAARTAVAAALEAGAATTSEAIEHAAERLGYSPDTVRKRHYG